MKEFIYADNAATTKLDPEAFEAMKPYLLSEYGNPSQPYSFSRSAKSALKDARETVAECVGASPDEIYFTSGGTESDNWAVKGAVPEDGRNTVITSSVEHHAVLNSCARMAEEGRHVIYLPVDGQGRVAPAALRSAISDDTYLVSVMYSNNEIGTVQPIRELTRIAHDYGAAFHTDAVQAVGHVPLNVKDLDVDLLSASAHKFNGPKGVGFLYIRNGTNISSMLNGGRQESGLRAGTENVASVVGMATALKNNVRQTDENTKKIARLEGAFIGALEETGIDYIRNGSPEHMPGNICLSFRGMDGEMLLHRLDLMGIVVSTGAACDSERTQVSHVIREIKVPEEYAKGTIRISLSKNNTEEEAVEIASALCRIVKTKP